MDHLASPQDCESLSINVPYLANATLRYDGHRDPSRLAVPTRTPGGREYPEPVLQELRRTFFNFPARHGIGDADNETSMILDLGQRHSAEIARFLQTWLYFGLLHAVFGAAFHEEDFIDDLGQPPSRRIVNSSHLNYLVQAWQEREERLLPQPKTIQQSNHRGEFTEGDPQLAAWEAQRVHDLLEGAHRICLHFESLDSSDRDFAVILLSIRILLESLWDLSGSKKWRSVMEEACPMHQTVRFGQKTTWVEAVRKLAKLPGYGGTAHVDMRSLSMKPIVDQLLLRPGWCVHAIRAMCDTRHYATVIYMAQLRRQLQPWINHARCNYQDRCVAFNVDNETFECAHTSLDCTCEYADAPTESMHRILRSGGIPVLRIEKSVGPDEYLSLSYIRATPGRPYAALSHLWADGLGNVSANSIPECQLKRLFSAVTQANQMLGSRLNRDGVEVWLDVYCIPAIPKALMNGSQRYQSHRGEMKHLKKLALTRMTATYSWAYYVLVIEHELTAITSDHDHMEFWARLAVCGWNRRYWTFQENCLARIVAYECGDGIKIRGHRPYEPPTLPRLDAQLAFQKYLDPYADEHPAFHNIDGVQNTAPFTLAQPWTYRVWQDLFRLNDRPYATTGSGGDSLDARSGVRRLMSVWNELSRRTTTEWSDSLVIFANLLDLNIAELTALRPADSDESNSHLLQMKAILASQSIIPLELLINNMRRTACCHLAAGEPNTAWVPLSPQGSDVIEPIRVPLYMDPDLRRRAVGGWSPSDAQLLGTASACGLRVNEDGLRLIMAMLQPSPISASNLTGEYKARLVKLVHPRGRNWILDLNGEGFDGEYTETEYWVKPQAPDCVHDLLVDANEVLIVLNTSLSSQSPAWLHGSGACFLPTGDRGECRGVQYAYPVTWGPCRPGHSQSLHGFLRCPGSFVGRDEKDLLIQCDIKNWPKLTKRNDQAAAQNLSRRMIPAQIVALILMLTIFATIFGSILLAASNVVKPSGFWTIRNIWLLCLGISSLGIGINYALAIRHHLDDYLLQYSLLPKADRGPWWRELAEALPASADTMPAFKKRLDIFYFRQILALRAAIPSRGAWVSLRRIAQFRFGQVRRPIRLRGERFGVEDLGLGSRSVDGDDTYSERTEVLVHPLRHEDLQAL